jgi:gliding motility-associated-like protein
MKKFILLMFVATLILFANKTYSQCQVTAAAVPTTICEGEPVIITSNGSCGYLMNNDFDNGTPGAGWVATTGVDFSNPCNPTCNGTIYMWMGNVVPIPRTLTTVSLDVSGACSIQFDMKYATQSQASPCEGVDEYNEGVSLQYSTNGGTSWGDIVYFQPDGTQLVANPGTGGTCISSPWITSLTSWATYSYTIPVAAQTSSTQFRWIQIDYSALTCDHWGLDNIEIVCPGGAESAWIEESGDTVFWNTMTPPPIYPTVPQNPSTFTGNSNDTCYVIHVWDTMGGGYSATDTVCITVNPVPTASFTVNSPICEDEIATVTYTGNGTSGASYNWIFSGANIINGTLFTPGPFDLQWGLPGTRWISLQVTENGCSSPVAYDSVIVFDTPEVWFTADTTEGCAPVTINFTNLSVPSGDIWQWDFGDGGSSTQENPSHTYTGNGNYSVTLAVSTNDGCDDTLTWNNYIHIYPQPVAEFTMDPDPAKPGLPVNFTSSSVGDTWLWEFGDGNTSTDPNYTTHTYVAPDNYTVVLYVSNMYGCIDSTSQNLLCLNLEFPNVITPNGDGKNDKFVITGADMIASDGNPTNLRVYNRWGKKVFEADNYQNDWDGDNLADGVYYYVFEYLEEENYSGSLTILGGSN